MNLPKPNRINAEKYVAGLSLFNKKTAQVKLSANESALGPSPKTIRGPSAALVAWVGDHVGARVFAMAERLPAACRAPARARP